MKWIATLAAFLVSVIAFAGFDDFRVVARIYGVVQVRTLKKHRGQFVYGPWKPLRLHQTISSTCEVRTLANSEVWLQTGGKIVDPANAPTDISVNYDVVKSNSQIRLNSQYGRLPIFQRLAGTTELRRVKGRSRPPVVSS